MIFQNVALRLAKMMVFCKRDNSAYIIDSCNPSRANVPHHVDASELLMRCRLVDWFLYGGEHWSLMG